MMRNMDLELLQELLHGATATEQDGIFHLDRFTAAQRNVYAESRDFLQKSFAASAIRLEFETDAKRFAMDIVATKGSSRVFYYFDIVVNGELVRCDGMESCLEQPEFHLELPLDGKKNKVCIYFPNLVRIDLKDAVFEGASVIDPIRKKYKMICFGDSITQGYDAIHPSLSYPNQIADALDAEVFNKGIGGEVFRPSLATYPDPIKPDLITVAYGTNDWSTKTREELVQNSENFFRNLVQTYPETPIAAILPIWRKDLDRITKAGTFGEAREIIRKACAPYPAIHIIDGMKLVPHLDECFREDGLHPNDFGFQFMGHNLLKYLPEL